MADPHIHPLVIDQEKPTSNPSGATDQVKERIKKFEEEGGDQPQPRTQSDVDSELARARQQSGG